MKEFMGKSYDRNGRLMQIRFRGNEKYCEKYGEDLSLPRWIGDRWRKNPQTGKKEYPARSAFKGKVYTEIINLINNN